MAMHARASPGRARHAKRRMPPIVAPVPDLVRRALAPINDLVTVTATAVVTVAPGGPVVPTVSTGRPVVTITTVVPGPPLSSTAAGASSTAATFSSSVTTTLSSSSTAASGSGSTSGGTTGSGSGSTSNSSTSASAVGESGGTPSASSSTSTSKGVPAAAIAVPIVLLVLALLALNLFWIRRRFVRNRERKRGTYGASVYPFPPPPPPGGGGGYNGGMGMGGGFEKPQEEWSPYGATDRAATYGNRAYAAPEALSPPPASFSPIDAPPLIPAALRPGSPAPTVPAIAPQSTPTSLLTPAGAFAAGVGEALVRCTFIPSLPDELSIATGERVRVLMEYDDGWALCQNAAGAQGMVPLECLDWPGTATPSGKSGDWRNSKRASSLAAGYGLDKAMR